LCLQQQDQQEFNCQKEANQSANGKDIDEKEDFLHQIRTKVSLASFFPSLLFGCSCNPSIEN
jgi:hypothetical protein